MEGNNWIDISVALEDGMVYWPGDIPVSITKAAIMEKDQVNVTSIHLSAHTATHIDAPLHFLKAGKDVTQIPFDRLLGFAKVIQVRDEKEISLASLKDIKIEKGDHLLFKTRHSEKAWAMQEFQKDYVYLSKNAALYLVEKQVSCVGIDYLSIAQFNNGAEVHRILLEKEILIIEGLNLASVEPGNYEMICLPLKIKGGDGAPARVIIRKRYN